MSDLEIIVPRPKRWDIPFGQEMSQRDVTRLLGVDPFNGIDAAKFPASLPLSGILQNDTRIVHYQEGDLIVREGDYGSSAFLILHGNVRVTLQRLAPNLLGRHEAKPKGWLTAIAQLWTNDRQAEARKSPGGAAALTKNGLGTRDLEDEARVFLQDVPGVLDATNTLLLSAGEIFGEMAALTRTPRTATVFSEGNTILLEIRWQGLRDLMSRTPRIHEHIERLYRENSLRVHLRETPLLKNVPTAAMNSVVAATKFESYGHFDWNTDFKTKEAKDPLEQISQEPLIAEEGQIPNGLFLIRSGFVRVSRRVGHGHQTIAYLGKGQVFGMEELRHAFSHADAIPWQHSMRAVGYVDVLRIPTSVVFEDVFTHIPKDKFPKTLLPAIHLENESGLEKTTTAAKTAASPVADTDTRVLDFMVDSRVANGTQAMLIDLDRCTRCDDCVRACATAHDNNPRFIRHGQQHDHFMFANACMHCVDPVCMIGCPTGAIGRDAETGVVQINDLTCIGCGTCATSCPFENIRMVEILDQQGALFIDEKNNLPIVKATKCDLCVDQPGGPACQNACPHDALIRMDMGAIPQLVNWLGR